MKWKRREIQIKDLPGKPSMGNATSLAVLWNAIRYVQGSVWGGAGWGPYHILLSHSTLYLVLMPLQSCCKVCIAVRTEDLLVQSRFMCQALSCHPKSIGLCEVSPNSAIGLTEHTYSLPFIFVLVDPVKELCQDVKCTLESCHLRRHKNDVIYVELGLAKSLLAGLLLYLYHHQDSVVYYRIYHHIKDCEEYWVALVQAVLSLEGRPKVTADLHNHDETVPVLSE